MNRHRRSTRPRRLSALLGAGFATILLGCGEEVLAPLEPGWMRAEILSEGDTTRFFGESTYITAGSFGPYFAAISGIGSSIHGSQDFTLGRPGITPSVGTYELTDSVDWSGSAFNLDYREGGPGIQKRWTAIEGSVEVFRREPEVVWGRFEAVAHLNCLYNPDEPFDQQSYPCLRPGDDLQPFSAFPTIEIRGSFRGVRR